MSQTGGFPDWGRFVQSVADPLVVGSQALTGLHTIFGPYFVGAYPVTALRLSPASSGALTSYIIAFYADEALTELVGEVFYQTIYNLPIVDCVGNVGPWLTIECTDSAYSAGDTATISAVASTASVADLRRSQSGSLLSQTIESVPSGDSVQPYCFYITTGPAVLCIATTATDWTAVLDALVSGTDPVPLAGISNASANPAGPLYVALPGLPTQLTFTNNDGVARNFSASLTQAV